MCCPSNKVVRSDTSFLGLGGLRQDKLHDILQAMASTNVQYRVVFVPSEHPPVRGKNVKTFGWDHRLQRENLFMAFNRVPRWQ